MFGKLLRAIIALLLIGAGIILPYLPYIQNLVSLPYLGDRLTLPAYYVGVGLTLFFFASVLLYKKLPSVGIWMVYVVLMFLLSAFMVMSSFSLLPILSPSDVSLFVLSQESLTFNIIGLAGSALIPPIVIYLFLGGNSVEAGKPPLKKAPPQVEKAVQVEEEAAPSALSLREMTEKTMAYKSAEVEKALSQFGEPVGEMRAPEFPREAPRALDLEQELKITKGRTKSPLFTEDLEKSLSEIFGESPLAAPPAPRKAEAPLERGPSIVPPPIAPAPPRPVPSAVPEAPPGKLASERAEEIYKQAAAMAAKPLEQRPEGLKPVGKMLVDQEAVSSIIAGAEKRGGLTSTRIISAAKGRTLDLLLEDINKFPGVQGSVIVGKDGLVIGSTLPEEGEKELIGAVASSVYSNVDISCTRMNRGSLRQAILETDQGLIVISEIDVGIFIVLTGPEARTNLGELSKTIKQTLEVAKSLSKVS